MTVSATSSDLQMDFLTLFVTQLQNQNPLEPMDNEQMTTQLAQLSSLEQLENISATFGDVLAGQERLQATGLIGKEIEFYPPGQTAPYSGRVSAVNVYDEGVRLLVEDYLVGLDAILAVRD